MYDNEYSLLEILGFDDDNEESEYLKEDSDLLENIDSFINLLFGHLLKFLNQKNRQSKSWLDTISYSNKKIVEAYNKKKGKRYYNKVNSNLLEECYLSAVKFAAGETNMDIIPEYPRPFWVNADFIKDREAIKNLLLENASNDYVIDLIYKVFG